MYKGNRGGGEAKVVADNKENFFEKKTFFP
jgi:hypothetical protein